MTDREPQNYWGSTQGRLAARTRTSDFADGDCTHRIVDAFAIADDHPLAGQPLAFWACRFCKRRFEPTTSEAMDEPLTGGDKPHTHETIRHAHGGTTHDHHGAPMLGVLSEPDAATEEVLNLLRGYVDRPGNARGVVAESIVAALRGGTWKVHNHGPEEGRGVACREYHLNGRLVGSCKIIEATGSERDTDLQSLARHIAEDWNGRPDVCPRCGHSSVGCTTLTETGA